MMRLLTLLALLLLLVGCNGGSHENQEEEPNDTNASTLRLQLDDTPIHPGTSTPARLYLDESTSIREVTPKALWYSHDINTAYFDNGRIHAQRAGEARFTITVDAHEYNRTVTIEDALPDLLQCSAQTPNPHTDTSTQLRCSAHFDDNTSQEVTYDIVWYLYASAFTLSVDRRLHVKQKETHFIRAKFLNRETNLTIEALESPLLGLSLSRESLSLHEGTKQALQLYAHYGDGWVQEVSADANWSSTTPEVAAVDSGNVSAHTRGKTLIRATFGGYTSELTIDVKRAALQRLELSVPQSPWPYLAQESQIIGIERCIEATAYYDDGSSQRVTDDIQWRILEGLLPLKKANCFLSQKANDARIEAHFGEMLTPLHLPLKEGALQSFDLIFPTTSIEPSFQTTLQPFLSDASGTVYPIENGVFMHSSNTQIATVDSIMPYQGRFWAHKPGPVRIDASYGSLRSSRTLLIEGAQLLRIVFDPMPTNPLSVGAHVALKAYGYFSDGSYQELGASLQYTSSNPFVANVDLNQTQTTLNALSVGSTTISARFESVMSSFDLNVTAPSLSALQLIAPAPTLKRSDEMRLEAVGIYSNGERRDFSDVVTWSSYPTQIATVGTDGTLFGANIGTAVVTITYGTLSDTATVEVIEPDLLSIKIQPDALEVDVNAIVQMRAIAIYKDGRRDDITSRVTWRSLYPQKASVDTTGLVRGLEVGSAEIAAYYKGYEAVQELSVYKSPKAIVMVVPSQSMDANTTLELRCDLYYSDGSKSNITTQAIWSSSSPTVATIEQNGTLSAWSVGTTRIKVVYKGFEAVQEISVYKSPKAIVMVAPSQSMDANTTMELRCDLYYSDGSKSNITTQAIWSSSNPTVATIEQNGTLSAWSVGTSRIKVEYEGFEVVQEFSVYKSPKAIVMVVPSQSMDANTTLELRCDLYYSDGSKSNITTQAIWSSSNPTVATIEQNGTLSAWSVGTSEIEVEYEEYRSSTTITVTGTTP